MDLTFSPDIEAYYCYFIVLIVGAIVGVSQIRQRIGQIEGIWSLPRTWWLFALYVAIPVLLFWLLDRTSAINDTSVFAAILVGFGYVGIITGDNQSIRPPGGASQFWSPFLAYSDRIAAQVRDQDARRRRRIADQIVAEVMMDEARRKALEELARKYAPDIGALEAQIKTFDDDVKKRGEAATAEGKVRTYYNVMLSVPDAYDLMREKKIIGAWFYWLDVRGIKSFLRMFVCAVIVVGILILGVWHFLKPNTSEQIANYYIWRLGKANSTANDQFRTRQYLAQFLVRSDSIVRSYVMTRLADLVQRPNLPMERVDLALQIILQNRGQVTSTSPSPMPLTLVTALRAASVDARTRANEALKFLAESCKAELPAELGQWKPSDGDSTAALERQIGRWNEYWAKPCEAKTP